MNKLFSAVWSLLKRSVSHSRGELCQCGRRMFGYGWWDILSTGLILILSILIIPRVVFAADSLREWDSREDSPVINGLKPDTFPRRSGELSLRYRNKDGQDTSYSYSDTADFKVTHLSQVLFSPDTGPVRYIPDGDTAILAVNLINKGNGPDTFSLAGIFEEENTNWDTAVYFDVNADGVLDPDEKNDTRVQITNLAVQDSVPLLLFVRIPEMDEAEEQARQDTLAVEATSERGEDPEKGRDTAFLRVKHDTSSIDVFDPAPETLPDGVLTDTQALVNDTSVMLHMKTLSNTDAMSITYIEPDSDVTQPGWEEYSSDSEWYISEEDGIHIFKARYRYDDGQYSDTFTDSIVADFTPPADHQILIEDDAETTPTLPVNLSSSASDPRNYAVTLADGSVFADTVERSVNQDGLMADTGWVLDKLNSKGVGAVWAKFTDLAGNITTPTYDTILVKREVVDILGDTFTGLNDTAVVEISDWKKNVSDTRVDEFSWSISSDVRRMEEWITINFSEVNRNGEPDSNNLIFRGKFGFTQGTSHYHEGLDLKLISVDPKSIITIRYTVDGDTRVYSDTCIWLPITKYRESVEYVRTWPNPYKPLSGRPFIFQKLPADKSMKIYLYNVKGQLIRKLTIGRGVHYNETGNIARWWGKNDEGSRVASGTYIYVVESKYGVKRGKITLVK